MNIILKIKGGLGNQMFQYAFGRRIQEDIGGRLILDLSDYKENKKRKPSIVKFITNNNIYLDESGKYNIKYDRKKNLILRIGMKFFPLIVYQFFNKFGIYVYDGEKYFNLNIKKENKEFLYFNGYWQSEKWFESISLKIKSEFLFNNLIKIKSKEIINIIKSSNSVCVHIRLGDYLDKKNSVFNICNKKYYLNSINEIKNIVINPVFFIFSDNIGYVKNNFNLINLNVVFVDNGDDFEDILLMCNCKHFIISNSTFSWWAQYLGCYENKIVIAPTIWRKDKTVNDIYLNDWVTIPV